MSSWQMSITTAGALVTDVLDVAQCIDVICKTQRGSDPLRPDFGIDILAFIDKPITVAVPNLILEVTRAVAKYETRATIKTIQPTVDGSTITLAISWAYNGTLETTKIVYYG